ncbi:MAG: lipoyl(octanoyl) transferase LipB [Nitriliruptoraceae bacterium]
MIDSGLVPPPARLRADVTEPVRVVRAGTLPYRDAWDLQRDLVDARRDGSASDHLLLLEHPAVYTMGRRTDPANLRWDADQRRVRGIDLIEVDRGGDVTYHGPGQLVGYPILRLASLRSVVGHVRALEEVLIRTLATFGLTGRRVEHFTGVWIGQEKVAAIGVRVASGGITSHGFALNVHPDLDDFTGIVPCGIADRGVCSMRGLGVPATVDAVSDVVARTFGEVFGATLVDESVDALRRLLDHGPQRASAAPRPRREAPV